jgi:hypothetical protein
MSTDLARLESRIRARIGEMDLISLVELLAAEGFAPDELRLASHHSIVSQTGLIHDVELMAEPRQAKITLNLGLLSAQTPLPSYFFRKMDEPGFDTAGFTEFIGFFDHVILSSYAQHIYPELNRQLFPDWELARRRELQLINLRSPANLHWIFRTAFPELEVSVHKATLRREVRSDAMRLGNAVLGGDAVFGATATVPVQGRVVTLYASGDRAGSGKPWPAEIQERLHGIVFPILASVGVDLQVALVLREQETVAAVGDRSFLGYDAVKGGAATFRRIELHTGHVVD